MLLTCRSTVRSLIVSSSAMPRLVVAGRHQPQDLELARAQPGGRGMPTGLRLEPGQVRRRAQRSEHLPRRIELERRALQIAQLPAGSADPDANPRRFVRRVEVAPQLRCPAQRAERARYVALCQQDRALASRRHGSKQRGAQCLG